jgi:hypothetical protein
VLIEIADRLRRVIRAPDTVTRIVVRLRGALLEHSAA